MKNKLMAVFVIIIPAVFLYLISASTGVPTSDTEVLEIAADNFYENVPKASGEWGNLQESSYFNMKLLFSLLGIVGLLELLAALKKAVD